MLEALGVPAGHPLARCEELLQAGDLRDPDRAEQVRQPVVQAGLGDVERATGHDAVMAEAPNRVRELGIVGRHRTALTRRHDLAGVEGETAHHPERAAGRIAIASTERPGRVLDEHDLLGDGGLQLLPFDRPSEQVDGDDGLRSVGDGLGDLREVEIERLGIDVDEDGPAAAELDGVRRRRKRVGGDDHLVAGADPEGHHREVQRGRAGRDGNCLGSAAGAGEGGLELRHLGSHRQHPRCDDLGERRQLRCADVRAGEADRLAHVPLGRCSRYQPIVLSRPSSSSTIASNPSRSRALPMFGIRNSTST